MRKKSDKARTRRISATKASREFSALLDEIEEGRSFVIQRHGRDVCVMTSPPPPPRRKLSESLALLRRRTPVLLDDRFGSDLLEIIASEVVEDRSPWD